jgi:hypothetical protein
MAPVHVLKYGYPKGHTGSSAPHEINTPDFDALQKRQIPEQTGINRVIQPGNHPGYFYRKHLGGLIHSCMFWDAPADPARRKENFLPDYYPIIYK